MRSLYIVSFSLFLLAACGDDDSSTGPKADGSVTTDGTTSDGGSDLDGSTVCSGTVCGETCVDTSVDEDHCGECDNPCAAGEICTGTCECPANFVTEVVNPAIGDQILVQGPLLAGLGPILGDKINGILVVYTPELPTGVETELTAETFPAFAAGYDVNITVSPPTFHTAYLATSGTIELTSSCAEGVHGVAKNVQMQEAVLTETGFELVENGCTQSFDITTFDIGEACDQ